MDENKDLKSIENIPEEALIELSDNEGGEEGNG